MGCVLQAAWIAGGGKSLPSKSVEGWMGAGHQHEFIIPAKTPQQSISAWYFARVGMVVIFVPSILQDQ